MVVIYFAHYSGIILYSFACLLFSKLCWHNVSGPMHHSLCFFVKFDGARGCGCLVGVQGTAIVT